MAGPIAIAAGGTGGHVFPARAFAACLAARGEAAIAVTGRHVDDMEGESFVHALFRFASGVTASFDALLHASPVAPTEDFRVTGTRGEIVIEHGRDGRLLLFNAANPDGKDVMQGFQGKVDSYGEELRDFASAVLHGTELAAPPEAALGELRTALAMYRSVESGRWEPVWDPAGPSTFAAPAPAGPPQ